MIKLFQKTWVRSILVPFQIIWGTVEKNLKDDVLVGILNWNFKNLIGTESEGGKAAE